MLVMLCMRWLHVNELVRNPWLVHPQLTAETAVSPSALSTAEHTALCALTLLALRPPW